MKPYRVMAVVCLIIITVLTGFMIAALATGDSQGFFIYGGVLVGAVILSYVVVKSFKNRFRKEEKDGGTSEN